MYDESGTDKTDAQAGPGGKELAPQDSTVPSGPTRRTFSRATLAGSGVLLTLGNRSAWGTFDDWLLMDKKGKKGKKGKKVCVSTMMLESFQMSSHFKKHKDDPKLIKFMSLLDYNGNPPPGYTVIHEGRETSLIPPDYKTTDK